MANEPNTAAKPHLRNSLQSFSLANFKAFGANEQQIPLKPITLVFGPNSSGKSSIIHFLLWMKDVASGKGLDIYYPSAGGTSVDLGGFKQIRHGTASETEISMRLDFTIKDVKGRERHLESLSVFASALPPTDDATKLRFLIQQRWEEIRARNTFESVLSRLSALENAVVDHSLKQLLAERIGESTLELDLMENDREVDENAEEFGLPRTELRSQHSPRLSKAIQDLKAAHDAAFLNWSNQSSVLQEAAPPDFTESELVLELQDLARAILQRLNYTSPSQPETKPSLVRFELSESGEVRLSASRNAAQYLAVETLSGEWLQDFCQGGKSRWDSDELLSAVQSGRLIFNGTSEVFPTKLRFADTETPNESPKPTTPAILRHIAADLEGTEDFPGFLRDCATAAQKPFKKFSYLGPLRTYPPRNLVVADLPKSRDPEGLFAWRALFQDDKLRNLVNAWLSQDAFTSKYEIVKDDRVSLRLTQEKIREEIENRIGVWVEDIKSAQSLADERGRDDQSDKHLFAAGDWKYSEMVSAAMENAASKVTSESTGTIFIRDLRTEKQVSSRDIGVGISQLLPVLEVAKSANGEVIAIEQPELHIHPALQAELGDLFIESAMERGNTFLIETHSEHLVLRLMRRIRETTSGRLPTGHVGLRCSEVIILYVEPTSTGSIVREMPLNERGELVKGWPGGFFEEGLNELFGL